MAGRPAYCRCVADFDSRWILNVKGQVRCRACNGAAPHNLVERAAKAANANMRAAKAAPSSAPATTPEKKEVLTKVAASLNAKKEKEGETEAKSKTRKVGRAKVNSAIPAKTGGVVSGKEGQGYIFSDEPNRIYVVGDGWFGSWDLKDVTYREPGLSKNKALDFRSVDVRIDNIPEWNNVGSSLVAPIRALKNNMQNNGRTLADGPYSAGLEAEFYGLNKDNDPAYATGVWRNDAGAEITWAVLIPMWEIL